MAIDFEELTYTNPFLFHLTYRSSLARISRLMKLESAGSLLELGEKQDWIRRRREKILPFQIGNDSIVLTDQLPLKAGHVEFQSGWQLPDLVECSNRRVFFWRGKDEGMLAKDRGQFGAYKARGKELVFLRVPLTDAVDLNGEPEYCEFNSGGPRSVDGKKSPRGPKTFVSATDADFTLGKIREVVFQDAFTLPESTQVCFGSCEGPWESLREV